MDVIMNLIHSHQQIAFVFVKIIVVVLFSIIINTILRKIEKRLIIKYEENPKLLRDSFLKIFYTPCRFLVWIIALTFIIVIITGAVANDRVSANTIRISRNFIVLICGWFFIRWIKCFEDMWVDVRESRDLVPGLRVEIIRKLFTILIFIFTLFIVLGSFNVNLTAFLAVGGIGVAAIGFAAKDVLSNLFGGLIIYSTRCFSVGEWIGSPDKNIEGTVEEIGWYITKIRNFEKRQIFVPNGILSSIIIINNSRMSHRQIKKTIGLRYKDFSVIEPIINDIYEMLYSQPELDKRMLMIVDFVEYGSSSLDILVRAYAKVTQLKKFLDLQKCILLNIGKIIEKHGAEIAFPTSTLHIIDMPAKEEKGKK